MVLKNAWPGFYQGDGVIGVTGVVGVTGVTADGWQLSSVGGSVGNCNYDKIIIQELITAGGR